MGADNRYALVRLLSVVVLLDTARFCTLGRSFATASSVSTFATVVEQSVALPLPAGSSLTTKPTTVVVTIAARTDDAVVGLNGPLAGILPSIASVEGGIAITIKPPPPLVSCRAPKPVSSPGHCRGKDNRGGSSNLPLGPDGPMFSDEWKAAGVTAR